MNDPFMILMHMFTILFNFIRNQSGKSSLMSWPEFRIISQINKLLALDLFLMYAGALPAMLYNLQITNV